MRRVVRFLSTSTLYLALGHIGTAAQETSSSAFQSATVRFEQNATDGDAEVVFEVNGGDVGLSSLTIEGPTGRRVAEFRDPGSSTLGMREFLFESPEPPDPDLVRASYPEGLYTFSGNTVTGDRLWSQATLSHRLPAPAVVLDPVDGADVRASAHRRIAWEPVEEVARYLITIEQEDSDRVFSATIESTTSDFAVPEGFLQPGAEYQLAIGTVAPNGNRSFVESMFTVARGNE